MQENIIIDDNLEDGSIVEDDIEDGNLEDNDVLEDNNVLEDNALEDDDEENEILEDEMIATDDYQTNTTMKSTMVNASCQTDPEVVVIGKQEWDNLQQQKSTLQVEVQRLQEVVNKVQLSDDVLKDDDARVLKLYTGKYAKSRIYVLYFLNNRFS